MFKKRNEVIFKFKKLQGRYTYTVMFVNLYSIFLNLTSTDKMILHDISCNGESYQVEYGNTDTTHGSLLTCDQQSAGTYTEDSA